MLSRIGLILSTTKHLVKTELDGYRDFCRTTAIYPDAGKGNLPELMYLGLGIGEGGEIQGKIKKAYRDGMPSAFAAGIAHELGDLLWYIMRLADVLGFTLEDIIAMNKAKLRSRRERGALGGSGDAR